MSIRSSAAAAALLVTLGSSACAQQGQQMPHGQGMQGQAMPEGAASHEMMQAMEKMNRDMMQGMTGNPDQDFARMMGTHHQGAVDMAEIFLKNGKDPELRRMAEKTVEDQGREISELETWLEGHPAR